MNIGPIVKNSIGVILLIAGIASFGGSYIIYKEPLQTKDINTLKAEALIQCKKFAPMFNYNSSSTKDSDVIVSKNGLSAWEEDLNGFSMILTSCSGFQVEMFCMGSDCKGANNEVVNGTIMKLKYVGVN